MKGTKFGYIITSHFMPLLDLVCEAGVDVLIGVDPAAWDLVAVKQRLDGQICLWGGLNGHLTVEQGTAGQQRPGKRETGSLTPSLGGLPFPPTNGTISSLFKTEAQALTEEFEMCDG